MERIAVTTIQITPTYRDVKPQGHYVYVHKKSSNGEPFYVGKGFGARFSSKSRSSWWKRIASKHGVDVEICQDGMSRDDSILLEMWLIAKLRKEGYELCNMTSGGEGCHGYSRPRSDDERSKLRHARGRAEICCSNGMVFNTSMDAARWVSEKRGAKSFASAINLACSGRIYVAYGYSWWRLGEDPKPVLDGRVEHGKKNKIQVICSDGRSFASSVDASQQMRLDGYLKASPSAIRACCRGKISSAYGRSWWYEGSEAKEYVPRYVRSSLANKKP